MGKKVVHGQSSTMGGKRLGTTERQDERAEERSGKVNDRTYIINTH